MATENIRDKIANLENLIKNDEVQAYLQACVVEDAEQTTGDEVIDDDLKKLAHTARAVIIHCERKIAVRKPKLDALKKELDATAAI